MVLQTNPFQKASTGTRAKLYFSVLNQCNLKCNCCFLVQKWKMSYEAVFGGSRWHACVVSHTQCWLPTPPRILSIWKHFTVFIDRAAFCLTHREGLGSVYNSYFLESYFSTFICVCLEKIPPNILLLTQEPWQPLWLKKFTEHWRGWDGMRVVDRMEISEVTFIFQHDGF